MNYIQETVKKLNACISDAKAEIAILEKCVALLTELVEEPESPPDNSHEDKPSAPVKHSRSGLVGVYPVGKGSTKWYASVTEKGKTKRLPRTYDTAKGASEARSEYLAKRDEEPTASGEQPNLNRTFGLSHERPV